MEAQLRHLLVSNEGRIEELAMRIDGLRESHDRLLTSAKAALLAGHYGFDEWMALAEAIKKAEQLL